MTKRHDIAFVLVTYPYGFHIGCTVAKQWLFLSLQMLRCHMAKSDCFRICDTSAYTAYIPNCDLPKCCPRKAFPSHHMSRYWLNNSILQMLDTARVCPKFCHGQQCHLGFVWDYSRETKAAPVREMGIVFWVLFLDLKLNHLCWTCFGFVMDLKRCLFSLMELCFLSYSRRSEALLAR